MRKLLTLLAATMAPAAPPPAKPPRDDLLIPSKDSDNVLRYDAASGTFVDEFVRHKDGRLNQPCGAISGPSTTTSTWAAASTAARAREGVLRYDGATGDSRCRRVERPLADDVHRDRPDDPGLPRRMTALAARTPEAQAARTRRL